ncbi:MAG TPA: hypothetical protein VN132_08530 [Bdellovibrio sp.]|nr:hypothetical protein [Bdellovibrio sp.]
MKMSFLAIALLVASSAASANVAKVFNVASFTGKVYSLNPGQTLQLADGSVVACMGSTQPPPPAKLYQCKIMPQGSPIVSFCGVSAASPEAALQLARANCSNGLAGNPTRQQFCTGGWQNYSCKEIDPVDAGICD